MTSAEEVFEYWKTATNHPKARILGKPMGLHIVGGAYLEPRRLVGEGWLTNPRKTCVMRRGDFVDGIWQFLVQGPFNKYGQLGCSLQRKSKWKCELRATIRVNHGRPPKFEPCAIFKVSSADGNIAGQKETSCVYGHNKSP